MDQETFDCYVKAGRIAAQAREYGKSLIVIGASLLEVTEEVEKKIIALGGEFAFPPQISLNDIAAHYCADAEDKIIFKEGDVAKLDVGVHVNGCVGDTATTVVLGNDEKLKQLAEASRAALNDALKVVKTGAKIGDIGKAIQKAITSRGFLPIINLSGHGLDKFVIHDAPSIPNIEVNNDETLTEDQVIAIEPFASTGAGMIYESANATIFAMNNAKPVRSQMSREVLRTISEYQDLPFAKRWLVKKHGAGKTNFALRELVALGILKEYPPLPDRNHGIVSQAEHTVIVREKPVITTMLDE